MTPNEVGTLFQLTEEETEAQSGKMALATATEPQSLVGPEEITKSSSIGNFKAGGLPTTTTRDLSSCEQGSQPEPLLGSPGPPALAQAELCVCPRIELC